MSEASSATPLPPVDLVEDGMTDDEIASHTDRWRAELDRLPVVAPAVDAAALLEAIRANEAQ